MQLKNLLKHLHDFQLCGSSEMDIKSIVVDSREVKKGSLFVAIKGLTIDAHDFIENAIRSGVCCVVGEKKPEKEWLESVTYVQVKNSRKALSLLAAAWNGNPSEKLTIVGITGTEGKTTTASLIYYLLTQAGGYATGLVSTVSVKIGKKEYDTGLHVTNPEPLKLQKFLAQMVSQGCKYAVLEVTSHGLDQGRVFGIKFDIAVLTNINHDHLDYHKTWELYRLAKMKLFQMADSVILNKDDKSYGFIKKRLKNKKTIFDYSVSDRSTDIYADEIKHTKGGTKFVVFTKKDHFSVRTNLLGEFNVSNILAAIQVARMLKVPKNALKKALFEFKGVVGRLEKVKNKKGLDIYIDFAHKPNSLKEVLSFLKRKTNRKLICVVGCVGERDTKKRPMMGNIASELADVSIFTADDPRSEDPNKIIKQMVSGVKKERIEMTLKRYRDLKLSIDKHWFIRIPERGEAIAFAIQKVAKKGDVVVVCGKGHEQSLPYNGIEYPWSDHDAVRIALKGGIKKIKRK
jgi:UDP-N-acetylmuramoyl-L-alanyl-D-glutamate--2,6-diaminopimelate ligase